jgi:uncharacterized protein (TIGR03067 family)
MSATLKRAAVVAFALLVIVPVARGNDDPEPPARDKRIEGRWVVADVYGRGAGYPRSALIEFTDREQFSIGERRADRGRGRGQRYKLGRRKAPAEIDLFYNEKRKWRGIYKVEKGMLLICSSATARRRR